MSEPLQAWHEFYFLLGTSAAALTGLMGVVISINPDTIAERPTSGVRAFRHADDGVLRDRVHRLGAAPGAASFAALAGRAARDHRHRRRGLPRLDPRPSLLRSRHR